MEMKQRFIVLWKCYVYFSQIAWFNITGVLIAKTQYNVMLDQELPSCWPIQISFSSDSKLEEDKPHLSACCTISEAAQDFDL